MHTQSGSRPSAIVAQPSCNHNRVVLQHDVIVLGEGGWELCGFRLHELGALALFCRYPTLRPAKARLRHNMQKNDDELRLRVLGIVEAYLARVDRDVVGVKVWRTQ